ncbi:MAG TPA: peptidoglycan DD-metalloendopeptidase family protein [Burkholderiales bacterium]|nr:peptidoglycan DD-metalloendopeptidase family protein [Burkholderiales bacterium]
MNFVFRREGMSLPLMLAALIAALGAGCASMPTAAPVLERSPNASRNVPAAPPAIAPTKAAPVATAPAAITGPTASTPQTAAPPNAGPPAASTVPKAETPVSAATEEPLVKPYREGDWRPEFHVVKKGDTLYSIALDYGQDYRELAAWNNLEDPALIRLDQRLRLFPPDSVGELAVPQAVPLPVEIPPTPVAVPLKTEPKARKLPYSEQALAQLRRATPKPASPPVTTPSPPPTAAPFAKPAVKAPGTPAPKEAGSADVRLVWEWPTQGKLIYAFGEGTNQKGVGIEGRSGQAVLASAPGKVVYSGSGLRGYGKLIIIKHNTSYLSVYAHNSQILVKEGQSVAKGQKIAEMGNSDGDRVALHFEIRRLGKPIDPLQYLPGRNS